MILARYSKEPNFPATDNHPDAVRYEIGGSFVDAIGTLEETEAECIAVEKQQRKAALEQRIRVLELDAIESRKIRESSIGEMTDMAVAYGAQRIPPLSEADSIQFAYMFNIAFRKTVDLDMQITMLRTEMAALP